MTHKIIEGQNGQVHYWISEKKASSILLIHGALMDHNTFKKQVTYFSENHTVITVDLPWHGLSQPCNTFSLQNACDEIIHLLNTEQIDSVHIVGQSMGGLIGQMVALQNTARVQSLTVIGSAPLQAKYYPKKSSQKLERWVLRLFPYQFLVKAMSKKIALSLEGQQYIIEVMQFNTKQKLLDIMKWIPQQAEKQLNDTPLDIPVLITYGEKDITANIITYSKQWAKQENRPIKVISNAAHNANLDNPKMFNLVLSEFLAHVTAN